MRVPLDQAGQQRETGEIDDAASGSIYTGERSGGFDALAADAHGPTFMSDFAIEDASGFENGDGGVGVALASPAAPATLRNLSSPGLGEKAEGTHQENE
jgi:hypothetical protein